MSLCRYYLPLTKGGSLHLNKLESFSPRYALCQVWLKLILGKLTNMWKLEQTDRQGIRGFLQISLELLAQVSKYMLAR